MFKGLSSSSQKNSEEDSPKLSKSSPSLKRTLSATQEGPTVLDLTSPTEVLDANVPSNLKERSVIQKKCLGNFTVPIMLFRHPDEMRNLRPIDANFVDVLKKAILQRPWAIVAPIGINITSNYINLY